MTFRVRSMDGKLPAKSRVEVIPSARVGIMVHRLTLGGFVYPDTEAGARKLKLKWVPHLDCRVFDESPEDAADFFIMAKGWSRHAYTFDVDGPNIAQTAGLWVRTPHALTWSNSMIGMALRGDFRKEAPPEVTFESAARTASYVCWQFGWHPYGKVPGRDGVLRVHGHDEAPGASADPTKRCPGDALSMDLFRDRVVSHLRALPTGWKWADKERALRRLGFTF